MLDIPSRVVYNSRNLVLNYMRCIMRIVVKVGTSTLMYGTGHLNVRRVEALCRVLSDLKNAGNEVVLVS